MKLHRLEVKHFGGVRSAEIDFGPGLNVLHAPNETGKSTLLRAIRAALLLQTGASAHEEFVDWHTDQPPRVVLTFETEPHQIWRIDKCFGPGGASYLEFSKDGTSFSREAKGREVDGKIRELLAWGIAAPGGAGRTRGYPVTYLTTALLGEQDAVDAVLEQRLADADDSGKQRLTAALQALAEDPVFRRVLESVHDRVSEAFTTTGRKRSGKGSPWKEIQESRLAAQKRREEVRDLVEESESAQAKFIDQQQRVDETRANLEQAKALGEQIEIAWKQSAARTEAQRQVDEARAALRQAEELRDAAAQTRKELDAARTAQGEIDKELDAAQQFVKDASSALETSRNHLRELESDTAEQERKLRMEELRGQLTSLDSQAQRATSRRKNAERLRECEAALVALKKDTEIRSERIADLRKKLARLEREAKALKIQVEGAEHAKLARTLLSAEESRDRAKQNCEAEAKARESARAKRVEAETLAGEVAALGLPDDKALRALRKLETELHVAEHKLEVGLSVRVVPHGKISLDIDIDGESEEHVLIEPGAFDARSAMTLKLPGADVHVEGGTASVRAEAKKLRAAWDSATAPVLSMAGVASLDDLEKRANDALTKSRSTETILAEAIAIEARADGAGDVGAALVAAEQAVETARAALPESMTLEAARQLAVEPEAEADPAGLAQEVTRRQEEISDLKGKLARDEGIDESKQAEIAAANREQAEAAAELSHGWEIELSEAEAALTEIASRKSKAEKAREELGRAATTDLHAANAAVSAAEKAHEQAAKALAETTERRDTCRQNVAALKATLEAKEAAAKQVDLPAAKERLAREASALQKLPIPEQEIDDEQRADSERLVEAAQKALRTEQDALRKFEGGLEQVGGQYIEEALQQAEERVQAVADLEREKDLDYGAWKLLEETLKEAEADGATHLGKALVEPVEHRMAELTGGRYGAPAIGPALETDGIAMAGEKRPLERLSIGTKEQLATVLRLTIAEKLGTFVVLDDQLVQSDPDRMSRFAEFMHQCATEIQVLVLTCRPDDYSLGDDENVTLIDLTARIQRTDEGVSSVL